MNYEQYLLMQGIEASKEAMEQFDALQKEHGNSSQIQAIHRGGQLKLAQENGDSAKLPTVEIELYNGKPIEQWYGRIIIDVAGVKFSPTLVILWAHDTDEPIGHSTSTDLVGGSSVMVSGVLSAGRDDPQVARIIKMAKNGFPWQASMGADILKKDFIEAGASEVINGEKVEGPMMIARESNIFEASILPLGADSSTSTSVAAKKTPILSTHVNQGENMKKFEQWLLAKGFKLADLTEEVKASLKEMHDAEIKASKEGVQGIEAGKAQDQEIADLKAGMAEMTRVSAIKAAAGKHSDLCKTAIEKKMTVEAVEAAVVEIEKVQGGRAAPAVHIKDGNTTQGAIEAALCASAGVSVEASKDGLSDEDMNEASSLKNVSFMKAAELLLMSAGVYNPRDNSEDMLRAAFSTTSLPTILGNTANKVLRNGYAQAVSVIDQIALQVTVNDFKPTTLLNLTEDLVLKAVGASGEIQHGESGEESSSISIDQYARQYTVDRKTLINDDLGAFQRLFARYGKGAATAENQNFFGTMVTGAGSFYHADNNNLVTTNALSIDGLTAAFAKIWAQTDSNGDPIFINGVNVVVPPALYTYALQLEKEMMVNETTTSNKPKPASNPWVGRFKTVMSPYLNNANVASGGSATTWFLVADPADVPAFASAKLSSAPQPTVRQEILPVGSLGVATDSVFDFGSSLVDPKGVVKNTA